MEPRRCLSWILRVSDPIRMDPIITGKIAATKAMVVVRINRAMGYEVVSISPKSILYILNHRHRHILILSQICLFRGSFQQPPYI